MYRKIESQQAELVLVMALALLRYWLLRVMSLKMMSQQRTSSSFKGILLQHLHLYYCPSNYLLELHNVLHQMI